MKYENIFQGKRNKEGYFHNIKVKRDTWASYFNDTLGFPTPMKEIGNDLGR